MHDKGEHQKMFEIPLKADTIAVHNNFLLCRYQNTIKIYRYNDKFTLTLIKTFNKSALVFMERFLSDFAIILMYKIVLDLTSKDIEIIEIEEYLSSLMDKLDFNKIKTVEYTNQHIIIRYKENYTRIYDSKLGSLEISEDSIHNYMEEDKKISVKTIRDKIILKFNGDRILTRSIDNIMAMDRTGDNIFLLHKAKLTVIALN